MGEAEEDPAREGIAGSGGVDGLYGKTSNQLRQVVALIQHQRPIGAARDTDAPGVDFEALAGGAAIALAGQCARFVLIAEKQVHARDKS